MFLTLSYLCLTSCTEKRELYFHTLFANNAEILQNKLHEVKQIYSACNISDDRICLIIDDGIKYGDNICYTISFSVMEDMTKGKTYRVTDSLFFAFEQEIEWSSNECVASIIHESSLKLLVTSSYSGCRFVYCDFDMFPEQIVQFNKDLQMQPFKKCILEKASFDTKVEEADLIREEP